MFLTSQPSALLRSSTSKRNGASTNVRATHNKKVQRALQRETQKKRKADRRNVGRGYHNRHRFGIVR